MKLENEITVLVNTTYDLLDTQLKQMGFEIKEEYQLNDTYMIDKNINIAVMNNLDILSKTILVREIEGIKKELLYKYKKYAKNGDIIEQGKIACSITDIDKAINFMESINYKILFNIYDKCIVYANNDIQFAVQLVNNKYIFIEMEDTQEFTNKSYNDIELMKQDLLKYNLPIDKTNFFVKKAELLLNEIK